MKRASFWYKEKAQAIAFVFGFIIAILINVDTIAVAQQLWRDPTLRQSLVAQAQTIEENAEVVSVADLEDYYQEIRRGFNDFSDNISPPYHLCPRATVSY